MWDTFGTTLSGTNPFIDPGGYTWFFWGTPTRYPRNSRYWNNSGTGEFRVIVNDNPFTTMNVSEYSCSFNYAYDNQVSFLASYNFCIPTTTRSLFINSPCEGNNCTDLPTAFEEQDYPFDRSYDFANGMQGVTHNNTHWFATSSYTPFCFFGCDKTSRFARFEKHRMNDINSNDYIEGVFEPGYRHPGGIDYYNGWVYIALSPDGGTSKNTAIGAIRQDRFSRPFSTKTHKVLKILEGPQSIANKKRMSWVARDPLSGFWYSSKFNDNKLYRYQIPTNSSGIPQSIKYCGEIDLGFQISRVQGGVFSPSGRLYITQDTNANEAIAIIEMQSLFLGEDTYCDNSNTVTVRPDFVGNFHVNFIPGDEEIEGLRFWDLGNNTIPGMTGMLHAIVLDVGELSNDDFYFKHLTISPKEEF